MKIRWDIVSFLLGLAFVLYLLQNCNKPMPKWDEITPEEQIASLKKQIVVLKEEKAQVKDSIVYKDSIRIEYKIKWKTLKDTIRIPQECDTIARILITSCDSVLQKSEDLINEQRKEITLSDSIISRQGQVILTLEDTNLDLKKEVKRQKRKKVIAWITAGIAAGLAIAR